MFKGSVKRLEFWSKFILFCVSITLATFLVLLSEKFMADIPQWFERPNQNSFIDKSKLEEFNNKKKPLTSQLKTFDDKISTLSISWRAAQKNYRNEKLSFENWLKARKTIGSPSDDSRVRTLATKLDKLRQIVDAWQDKLDAVHSERRALYTKINAIDHQRGKIQQEGYYKYNAAFQRYLIKIFFVRLAIILPIMILAFYLLVKFKRSKFRPLIWGYTLFSVHAFFFGLVPYLPSFGGYIRYTVGVILTLAIGYYVIIGLARYTARKKAELEESREGREQKIQHETAVKAYNSHSCPSCERDFLLNKWAPKAAKLALVIPEDEAPSFCHHCGIKLFDKCPSCQHRNFVHFPFCANCGESIKPVNA